MLALCKLVDVSVCAGRADAQKAKTYHTWHAIADKTGSADPIKKAIK